MLNDSCDQVKRTDPSICGRIENYFLNSNNVRDQCGNEAISVAKADKEKWSPFNPLVLMWDEKKMDTDSGVGHLDFLGLPPSN